MTEKTCINCTCNKDLEDVQILQDQIGTLIGQCQPNIKSFVTSKIKIYGDSFRIMQNMLMTKSNKQIKFDQIVNMLISLKIARLMIQFKNNFDYSDSLSDLLSYTWILNNQDEYFKIVDNVCFNKE